MECIGAIDQGTQSTRFFLYDRDGRSLAHSQVEVPQIYPKSGWVEQDAMAIWGSVQEAMAGALDAAREAHGAVAVRAVGITNQRETTVVWDRCTGRPLHNAIVWLDGRTADVCDAMAQRLPGGRDHFRPVTGLPISTYFSAYKLKWLLENVSAVAAAAAEGRLMFGTVDSWLLYKLTGDNVHVTDVSNASRTNLMDLATQAWHAPTLAEFGIRAAALPAIRSNAEVFGHIHCGSPLDGVPLAGCLGDQQAAMLGQRCLAAEAKCTYGTGCFMLLHTGPAPVQSQHGLLTTVVYQLGPGAEVQYALEGAVAIAGQGVSWLRDRMGFVASPAEAEELAATVEDTGGVYFVPAFSGLLAPWWREDARGAILGLTQYTTKAHVVRALLEAICFQAVDVLLAMKADADVSALKTLAVDGGASRNNLLMQMQADLLQVPVSRPAHLETTSLGAALAAGVGIRFWSEDEVFTGLKAAGKQTVFHPSISAEAAAARHRRWRKAVQRSFDLADLEGDD